MKNAIACFWMLLMLRRVNAQSDSIHSHQPLTGKDKEIVKWVGTLYEQGIQMDKDSLILSVEVQQLLVDEDLRSALYPKEYTWPTALTYLNAMELKKAFWFLINLYPDNKELVMRTILAYDELFEMDYALLGAFYTYSMIDPSVCHLEEGVPVITRPDIVEAKLASVKEMVGYIQGYRAQAYKD